MEIASYPNATLTAPCLNEATHESRGAIYDSDGQLVVASLRATDSTDPWHSGDPDSLPPTTDPVAKPRVSEAVFGGHIFAGWGHVITETISTAWAAKQIPEVPVVFLPWGRFWASSTERAVEVIQLAGWDGREVILAETTHAFGVIHVPERAIDIAQLLDGGGSIPREMNEIYERMRAPYPGPTSPVFFARPRTHRRYHPAEAELEDELAWQGFTIVRGWEISVAEQIAAACSATEILGFSGSNLHNSVFANVRAPVIELIDSRERSRISSGGRSLQQPICALRKQHHTRLSTYYRDSTVPMSLVSIQQEMARVLQ